MIQMYDTKCLDLILEKAYHEITLSKKEIVYLLGLNKPEQIEQLFNTARKLRRKYFNDKIYMYGFIYFSTHCRNDCTFCMYRKSNKTLIRYRKTETEILEIANMLAHSGVHLLDLTMGEDTTYFTGAKGLDQLLKIIESIKKHTGLPLMISPGLVNENYLKEFKDIGVNWYALYQETHNRELYARLRIDQDYDERMKAKITAHRIGMLIEEGILTGIGDTNNDVAYSLLHMENLRAEQVRVMSFVPQKKTPMEKWETPSRLRELLIIAVMRLLLPDRLIPASLDVDGISGLKQRLEAGSNVVTSIIPPKSGLAGVSNSELNIEEGNRTVIKVKQVLEELELVPATSLEYMNWVNEKQRVAKRIARGVK
ncbi:MAG: methylornithine synthase PylB [Dehalobacterium sp.]